MNMDLLMTVGAREPYALWAFEALSTHLDVEQLPALLPQPGRAEALCVNRVYMCMCVCA